MTRVAEEVPSTDEEGRWEPPVVGDEGATLLGFLERQRATFAWKSGDLDAAALRATLGPSAMTLGGMLKHLARFEDDMSSGGWTGRGNSHRGTPWTGAPTRRGTGAAPPMIRPNSSTRSGATRWPALALFAAAMAEGGPARRAGVPDSPAPSLRYILLNMIEEYARHNGHADLIRESIDGRVGHDPPR